LHKVYRRQRRSLIVLPCREVLMPLWKLTLSYDGTSFYGWQIQPDLRTVQGTLAAAIRHITGEAVLPQGSGRTDAGVHALGQVASFSSGCPIPAANLHRALNRMLPGSVRVLEVQAVEPPFHARHSAVRKTYEYRIFPSAMQREDGRRPEQKSPAEQQSSFTSSGRICSPMLAPYVWDCPLPLDLQTLNRAASHILGCHDFTSFAATGLELPEAIPADPLPGYSSTPPAPCRTIDRSAWTQEGGLLVYRVTGSGFLHHMVRNLVGTFVQAGAGRLDADAVPRILAARNRAAAGPTAPARGLFLVDVEYA